MANKFKPSSVSIVILNWNGTEDTIQCMESVEKTDYSNFNVILVDNGSEDNCVYRVKSASWSMPVDIIENGNNYGYAKGNNIGILRALDMNSDFILVLNNDTVINNATVPRLLDAAKRHPKAGVFGPCNFYMNRKNTIASATSYWNSKRLSFDRPLEDKEVSWLPANDMETEFVCGAALFFRREVADAIGLFDERFFLTWEETDWCFRARNAGFLNYVVPSSTILHKVAASFDSEESPLRTYFTTRNRLLWVEKNCSWRDRWRLIGINLRQIFPRLRYDSNLDVSIFKKSYWTLCTYLEECKTRSTKPRHKAYRRAIADYLFRNFGDCPQTIRQLNRSLSETSD